MRAPCLCGGGGGAPTHLKTVRKVDEQVVTTLPAAHNVEAGRHHHERFPALHTGHHNKNRAPVVAMLRWLHHGQAGVPPSTKTPPTVELWVALAAHLHKVALHGKDVQPVRRVHHMLGQKQLPSQLLDVPPTVLNGDLQ